MKLFLKKNKNKKIVILDIPLLLENKINHKKDILIFVDSKKKDIEKRLIKRKNFDQRLYNKFKSKTIETRKTHRNTMNNIKKTCVFTCFLLCSLLLGVFL